MSPEPELAPGYYVDNFRSVLATVGERYEDLLDDDETELAATFDAASQDAQRLYVRLISRKGPWFRLDLLRYDEIDDVAAAADELVGAGLARHAAADVDPVELLPTLRKPELVEMARALGAPPAIARDRRGEVEEWLVEAESAPDPVELQRVLLDRHVFLRPTGDDHVLVYRLLFFGDLYQDLSRFVVRDLGIVRYVDYPLDRDLRLFRSRREIDHHLELRLLRRELRVHLGRRTKVEASQLAAAVELGERVRAGVDAWHPSARRQVDRILVRVGRALERAERDEEALRFYRVAEAPPARERRCRVLERRGEHRQALALCRAMAAEPRDETEAETAPVLERRLARKLGLEVEPRRRRETVEIELPRPDAEDRDADDPDADDPGTDDPGVERRVVEHLASEGRTAIRSENWLWKSLFGLAFWDVIFAPVPGAFEHPFQLGPLDFHTADFRRTRREAVEARLEELRREDDLGARLGAVYEAKKGLANAWVPWHPSFEEPIFRALEIIRGPELATVSDRLSRDPGRYRRGLPDLLVADPRAPGGFELWEVKAPGDQLRPEQKSWMAYLGDKGLVSRVVKVLWKE